MSAATLGRHSRGSGMQRRFWHARPFRRQVPVLAQDHDDGLDIADVLGRGSDGQPAPGGPGHPERSPHGAAEFAARFHGMDQDGEPRDWTAASPPWAGAPVPDDGFPPPPFGGVSVAGMPDAPPAEQTSADWGGPITMSRPYAGEPSRHDCDWCAACAVADAASERSPLFDWLTEQWAGRSPVRSTAIELWADAAAARAAVLRPVLDAAAGQAAAA